MTQKEIKNLVKKNWSVELARIKPVEDVWRLKSNNGSYCLKPTDASKNRTVFMCEALSYLQNKGFTLFPNLIPTVDNRPYVSHRDRHFILTPWLDGDRPDFYDKTQLSLAVKTLALFHQSLTDFDTPAGKEYWKRYGKWHQRLKEKAEDFRKFRRLIEEKSYLSTFDRTYLAFYTWLTAMADKAEKALHESDYERLVKKARSEASLCHGDIAERNFIFNKDRGMCLIDFVSCKFDLRVVDIYKLIRRTLKKRHHDVNIALSIIMAYEDISILSASEKKVLFSYLAFPQKIWRLCRMYYMGKILPGWSEEKYARKIHEYFLQKEEYDNFINDLDLLLRREEQHESRKTFVC